jgi:hypothetical protein
MPWLTKEVLSSLLQGHGGLGLWATSPGTELL